MYPLSGPALDALRSSRTERVVCEVWRAGVRLLDDLEISGGSVTDTSAPGVRRQLDLDVIRRPGLFDLLSPTGTEIRPFWSLELRGREAERVPMGVFDVDSESLGYGPGGGLSVNGSDRFVKIQRAEFLLPQASLHGALIVDQIAALVRQVLGPGTPVVDLTGSQARVGILVWEGDRAKVINELAASIGAWFYFDRQGVATIAPLPTFFPGAGVWTVDAGSDGVLLDASRTVDRSDAFNVVIASTEIGDGTELFPPVIVWDDDPASPTYAGTDPLNGTDVGPFGIVPVRISSPLFAAPGQAEAAARTKLLQGIGRGGGIRATAVRNLALDSGDPTTVVLPRERRDLPWVGEVHLVEKVTHPFGPDGDQSIETRTNGVVVTIDQTRPVAVASGFGVGAFGSAPFGGAA